MTRRSLTVLMVDPSLFTVPYDEKITEALRENGVNVEWACRNQRKNEHSDLLQDLQIKGVFYPGKTESVKNSGMTAVIGKGISHVVSMVRLFRHVRLKKPDIVHFQWIVFPLVDLYFIKAIRRFAPVIATIHDTLPFNGNPTSSLQTLGLNKVLSSVDHIIVHTKKAAETMEGIVANKTPVSIVAHGPLCSNSLREDPDVHVKRNEKWCFLLFGKLQPYKGVEVLIKAVSLMSAEARDKILIVIAGESFIDSSAVIKQIDEYGLKEVIELRLWRQTEEEVEGLITQADAFVFPYKQIDASGVLYLIASCKKWIVASDIGIFHELIDNDVNGYLVQAGNSNALAASLEAAIDKIPMTPLHVESWRNIGNDTHEIYKKHIKSTDKKYTSSS